MASARNELKAVAFYLTKEDYAKFKKMAEQEYRTLANMASFLALREIEKRGITLTEEEREKALAE